MAQSCQSGNANRAFRNSTDYTYYLCAGLPFSKRLWLRILASRVGPLRIQKCSALLQYFQGNKRIVAPVSRHMKVRHFETSPLVNAESRVMPWTPCGGECTQDAGLLTRSTPVNASTAIGDRTNPTYRGKKVSFCFETAEPPIRCATCSTPPSLIRPSSAIRTVLPDRYFGKQRQYRSVQKGPL